MRTVAMMVRVCFVLCVGALGMSGCADEDVVTSPSSIHTETSTDADTDADTDTHDDIDADADTDTHADIDTEADTDTHAGTPEDTDTGTGEEVDTDGPSPIGSGWIEYFPEWTYHVPPNAAGYGERYTYEDGVFHLWVKDSDLSSFPGQDSGPRAEVRVKNEYTSGSRQFQADVMVVEGAEKVGIWQLFQRPYPWMVRIYSGEFKQYGNGSTFANVPFGSWQRLNTIHYSASQRLEIYLDGVKVLDTTISESDGSVDFYNKFGVYGRDGMGSLNEIYFKNVHYFMQD